MFSDDWDTFPMATDSDAVREHAENVGRERRDIAWILDPRDVWVRNPYYRGPAVPHPDDDVAPDHYDGAEY